MLRPLLVISIALDISRLIGREKAGTVGRVEASGELYKLYSGWVKNAT